MAQIRLCYIPKIIPKISGELRSWKNTPTDWYCGLSVPETPVSTVAQGFFAEIIWQVATLGNTKKHAETGRLPNSSSTVSTNGNP